MPSKPTVIISSGLTMKRYDRKKKATESNWNERDPLYLNYILPMQQEVAQEYNCQFIDLYHGLYDDFMDINNLASDHLHPNSSGYRVIAEYMTKNVVFE